MLTVVAWVILVLCCLILLGIGLVGSYLGALDDKLDLMGGKLNLIHDEVENTDELVTEIRIALRKGTSRSEPMREAQQQHKPTTTGPSGHAFHGRDHHEKHHDPRLEGV